MSMMALLVSKNIKKKKSFSLCVINNRVVLTIDVLKIVACHLNLLESLTLCFFLTFYIIFESYDKAEKTCFNRLFCTVQHKQQGGIDVLKIVARSFVLLQTGALPRREVVSFLVIFS